MSTNPKIKYPYRFVDPTSEYPDNRGIFAFIKVRSYEHYTKILSAGLEGAYLLYPDDHHDVSVPLMEITIMSCQDIADCLEDNIGFLETLKNYLVNDPEFAQSLGNGITQRNQIESTGYNSTDPDTKDLKQTTNSKDVVWGGSREVIEYWLDLLKTICFFLQGVGDVVDLVTQMYDKDKRKRFDFEAEDALNNPIEIGMDGEFVNPNGEWEFIPNILGQLVQYISESAMISFLSEIASLGANLILADITDTREEALTCIMFNAITCDGAQPRPIPYEFSNDTIYQTAGLMLGNLNAGLAGQAMSACMVVSGVANEFVSAFPILESHKNFRVGMRSPSDEWVELCDNCEEPTNWSYTFDFTTNPFINFWEASPVSASGFSNPQITEWEAGSGWGNGRMLSNFNNQSEIARIKGTFSLETIDSVVIEMQFIAGTSGAFANQLVLSATATGSFYVKALPNTGGYQVETRAFTRTENEFYIQVRGYTRAGNNNPNGATYIKSVTFNGTGFNPFI